MTEANAKTVLVVEDERSLANAIKTKLQNTGFRVSSVRSVEDALDFLNSSEKVDVVWLDHYLIGEKDGLDLVVALKHGNDGWKSIPVFVVSNTASEAKRHSYIQLGVDKYYVKAENKLDEIVQDVRHSVE